MGRFIFLSMLLLCATSVFSQKRVNWLFEYNRDDGVVIVTAVIDEGWHVYSQYTDANLGPVPTSFSFDKNEAVVLKGKVQEPVPVKEYDQNFGGEVKILAGKVVFRQRVRVRKTTELSGTVRFMACNDKMCLPPQDIEFKIELKK